MKSILVIGDSGLLGQALMAYGRTHQLAMRGASRRSADIALDACDAAELAAVLERLRPELVINAAGLVDINQCETSPADAWKMNTHLPDVVAKQCTARGIRFVHVSTDHYYVGDADKPHDEQAPVTLVNEYATSKYAGECLVLTHPSALVLRTNIVGLRGWDSAPTFAEWLLAQLEAKAPITLFEDFYTSSITANQFVEALFSLLEKGATGLLNVAASVGSSKLAFAEALAKACGLSTSNCSPGSVATITGTRRAESLVLDVRRAEKILGAALPNLEQVVGHLAAQYRQLGKK